MAIDDQLASLLAQNASLFAIYEEAANAQTMLVAGSINDPASFDAQGGKAGPLGYYPVINVSGQTLYVPCIARLRAISLENVDAAITDLGEAAGQKFAEVDDQVGSALAAFNGKTDRLVSVEAPQAFSADQQALARTNIGAVAQPAVDNAIGTAIAGISKVGSALFISYASAIPTLTNLAGVDVINAMNYSPANKGNGIGRWVRATKTTIAAHRMKAGDNSIWQLEARDGIKPGHLGASGRSTDDSTTGLLNALLYMKESVGFLLAGSPDPLLPRGGMITIGVEWYNVVLSLLLFSRFNIRGLVAQGGGGGNVDLSYIKSTAASLFQLSQNTQETTNRVEAFTCTGVSFQGKDDLSYPFTLADGTPVTDSYTISAYYWRVFSNTFRRLQPIAAYLIDSDWSGNYHLNMPNGNVVFGGSDSRVMNNNFNGDGYNYTANGQTVTLAPKDGYPVVHLRDFDNGRFHLNYVTGKSGAITGSTIIRPIPIWMSNCNETQLFSNWFDLSNASGIVMQACYDCKITAGRFCQTSLFPPASDMNGGVEISRYRQAILMIGSVRCSVNFVEIRENNYSTVGFFKQGTIECDEIKIDLDTSDLISHTLSFRFQDGTSSKAKRIYVPAWEGNRKILPMAPDVVGGSTMAVPFVAQATYSNKGATADLFGAAGPAISGRRYRVYQMVSSGFLTGFTLSTGDAIRGQAGKAAVRLAGTDIGKYVDLHCIDDGTWEVSSTGTPSYA